MMIKKAEMRLLHLSWIKVQDLSEKIAYMILKSNYHPNIIVAVSRGGFNPARILCDQLLVRILASVQIEFYTNINNKKNIPSIICPLNADVNSSKVLIVDDVSDSGETLELAFKHVKERGALEVRVATLHIKPRTKYVPHYYAEEVDSWIVYPWEPIESMKNISKRLIENGFSKEDIQVKLIELGFNQKIVAKIYGSSNIYKSSS